MDKQDEAIFTDPFVQWSVDLVVGLRAENRVSGVKRLLDAGDRAFEPSYAARYRTEMPVAVADRFYTDMIGQDARKAAAALTSAVARRSEGEATEAEELADYLPRARLAALAHAAAAKAYG